MRIGVISDVHANLPALDAVLDDLQDIDRIIHAGDLLGYNAFPNKTVNRFRSKNIDSITGNHDNSIVRESNFDFPDYTEEIIEWTRNEMFDENKKFITNLPCQTKLQIDNYTIQVVHGSPQEKNKYIYPTDLSMNLFENLDSDIDILIFGHTHYPIITKINNILLLNPGSVGQPRDGDWRASYAVFDTKTGNTEKRRIEYDIERSIQKAKNNSLPQQSIEFLR